jgi:REase_MTES_1575/Protein of unknown function (DUF3320)
VVDPQAPGRYLLGVECDGASYHSAATARDRDRLRGAVLKGLGWRLHRVWSTDFWQDPDGEIARIEAALAAAVAALAAPKLQSLPAAATEPLAAAVIAPASREPIEVAPSAAPPDADGPRPFVAASLPVSGTPEEFQAAAALRVLRTQIQTVLEQEGPVVFDRLAWITAAAWELSRVTDRVRDRIRSALPPTAIADGEVLWADAAQRDAFCGFREPGADEATQRAVEELPPVEIGNAMRWLLRQHQALAADDLAREAARCFGITRLGAVVKSTMAAVIGQLLADGRLGRDGEVLRLG